MPNERTTEDIVRRWLQKHAMAGMIVEEQSSDDPKIKKALAKASKTDGGGVGKPEFIVRLKDDPDFLIVFECKADPAKHVTAKRDKPDAYAVDGVLLYSAHLSKSFDVIGVAISGTTTTTIRTSTFRQLREAPAAEPLCDEHGPVERLLPVVEYQRLLNFDPAVRLRSQEELMQFGAELHDYLRDYAKLSENEKPLAVSGCLLALRDEAFKAAWRKYSIKSLGRELITALRREIDNAVSEQSKQRAMLQPYQFLEIHPELNRVPPRETEWPLRALIGKIEEHVRPFLDTYRDIDVIGQFYGEFLRYTGGDKKGLGIVLTPRHLTELFVKMARVGLKDTVLDNCCGTGGFLIAALAEMDAKADGDHGTREDIRKHRLVGVEQQPQMFALAASNMILRGDGKANLFQGNCFDPDLIEKLKDPDKRRFQRPTIGLINPPFAQQGEGLHELNFVANLLDILAPGGRAVVVVPMRCAIDPHPIRELILKNHTLVASVTLPVDLFHPIGVVTCGLMFEAHQPHGDSPSPTWFASWKNDGYVKQKRRGRIDPLHQWPEVRDAWLKSFHARATVPGQSISKHVDAADEWCAEAYMETDYSSVTKSDFERVVKNYTVYRLLGSSGASEFSTQTLNTSKWKSFSLSELFDIKKGARLIKSAMKPGSLAFISAIETNNGLRQRVIGTARHPAGVMTVNYNGNGVAEAFYQPEPFWASDDVNVLYPKFAVDVPIALFICAIIRREKYRFSYGRKWSLERMKESTIKLPATSTGQPDWNLMREVIKALPFGGQLS